MTTSQDQAKKTILNLIDIQIQETRTERNLAMCKVSTLRIKYLQTAVEQIKEQMEEAECELKVINIRAKALEEAELNINTGFGW